MAPCKGIPILIFDRTPRQTRIVNALRAYLLFAAGFVVMTSHAVGQYDPDFEEALDAYVKERRVGLDDAKLRKIVADWPGSRTMDGVRSMVAELLKPSDGSRRPETFAMLRHSEVPRQDVVTYLIESATAHRNDVQSFWPYFFVLREYSENDRIVKFLASLLDDQTIYRPPRRDPGRVDESMVEEPWRMCDAAHGTLCWILERRGEFKAGDPGYGDPGGEALIRNRDQNIAALKQLLIRSGYLAGAQPIEARPPSASPTLDVSPRSDSAPIADSSPPIPPETITKTGRSSEHARRLFWVGGAAMLAVFALILIWRRAKDSRP
jgi:hypothetical protein